MDNDTAERGLRPPVMGRKNYYDSGAAWSFELASSTLCALLLKFDII